ncbi:Tim44 domain-containing protein [Derxia gummosa]|uniref:Tim44 domain-containing protein n=1 Tax=Derxia gummosa DSM 723 TaxID=1121388 RepID=A0A8B6XAB9_9BURK|nr:Tim44-like domain-containing protein [Derxia gummosa]
MAVAFMPARADEKVQPAEPAARPVTEAHAAPETGESARGTAEVGAALAPAPVPPRRRTKEPKRVALAAPAEAAVLAPVAAPVASAGALVVTLVAAAGFVALFGVAPSPGVAVAVLAVALLLVLLAVIVPWRVAGRARRQRPVGPPVALPVRDLGPNTIGQLGREGSAEPVEPKLAASGRTASSPASAAKPPTAAADAPLPLSAALAREATRTTPRAPAGFDGEAFLGAAREHFLRLQQAWDDGDTVGMEAMMTPAMIGRVHAELERRQSERSRAERTEVLDLAAELLGVTARDGTLIASVRFRGAMRDLDATVAMDRPDAFDEIWNFDCADRAANRWLLAGIETLHA